MDALLRLEAKALLSDAQKRIEYANQILSEISSYETIFEKGKLPDYLKNECGCQKSEILDDLKVMSASALQLKQPLENNQLHQDVLSILYEVVGTHEQKNLEYNANAMNSLKNQNNEQALASANQAVMVSVYINKYMNLTGEDIEHHLSEKQKKDEWASTLGTRSMCFYALGRYDDARKDILSALELTDQNAGYKVEEAIILIADDNVLEALQLLDSINTEGYEKFFLGRIAGAYGEAHMALDDYESAIPFLIKARDSHWHSIISHHNLALAYDLAKQDQQALSSYFQTIVQALSTPRWRSLSQRRAISHAFSQVKSRNCYDLEVIADNATALWSGNDHYDINVDFTPQDSPVFTRAINKVEDVDNEHQIPLPKINILLTSKNIHNKDESSIDLTIALNYFISRQYEESKSVIMSTLAREKDLRTRFRLEVLLARIDTAKGNLDEALSAIDTLSARVSTSFENFVTYAHISHITDEAFGEVLVASQRFNEAEQYLRNATAGDWYNISFHHRFALALDAMGKNDCAVESYFQTVVGAFASPHTPTIEHRRALIHAISEVEKRGTYCQKYIVKSIETIFRSHRLYSLKNLQTTPLDSEVFSKLVDGTLNKK